jgi:excisionase family DNA binding protein
MRTDSPILIPVSEAAFQLSVSEEEIPAMIADGTLTAIEVRGQLRIVYESLIAFARREVRRKRDKGEKNERAKRRKQNRT